MMGRARASGEAQAMGVAVAFFKNLVCFVIFVVFIETRRRGPQIRTIPRNYHVEIYFLRPNGEKNVAH